MAKSISVASFRVVLEIGETEYECTDVSINFGLNRIPTAICGLASGRNVRTLQRATIHNTAGDFVHIMPATISLHPKGSWSTRETGDRWSEAGPKYIFIGYAASLGYRRSLGELTPTVQLVHWLSDLSFSSVLSNQSHPANPSAFRWWSAGYPEGIQATEKIKFVRDLVSASNFFASRITEDFWSKSLHQMFASLANRDILWNFGPDQCRGTRTTNIEMQKALRRFETKKSDDVRTASEGHHAVGASSPWWKPLSLQMGSVETQMARAIREFVINKVNETYFNATVWDKLVSELAASFFFSIVPRVHTAMVVPFTPGLRTTFSDEYGNGKVLDMRDISETDFASATLRPLRAVGVLESRMVSDSGLNRSTPVRRLGGCFAPDADATGMVLYREPPYWLTNVARHAHKPARTVFNKTPATATTPVLQIVNEEQLAQLDSPAKAANESIDYYSRIAHCFYVQEMLRGRYMVVQGKLRFDLAPGTTVAIRNISPRFLGSHDQLSRDMVGSISRVGITINSQIPAAATSFQLDYIRTSAENESDKTSTERHPLYSAIFTGAPLVDGYLFPE